MATITGPEIEECSVEFMVLLTLFAREPLMPVGLRRQGGRPVVEGPYYAPVSREDRSVSMPARGIDSPEFVKLLGGLSGAEEQTAKAILAAAKFYHAGLSLVGFDPSTAYVCLVSAIECLAGHHYKGLVFEFEAVEKFDGVRKILDDMTTLPEGSTWSATIRDELMRGEHFLRNKFVRFIEEHLRSDFWETPDDSYPWYGSVFANVTRENLPACLRKIYDGRSRYVHGGWPFPEYVEFGLRARHPVTVGLAPLEIRGKERYLPPIAWFERVAHLVIVEYMRRTCAPELVRFTEERAAERARVVEVARSLSPSARESLDRLVRWTARFVGFAMINPHAPNLEWADSLETIRELREAGLIGTDGDGMDGRSWLRDRDIGDAVGEVVFGAAANPFRDGELLLPKDWERLFERPAPGEGG
jgi:hypothetical protein